jgi:hypothetical protein
MKPCVKKLFPRRGGALYVLWTILALLAGLRQAAAQPLVSFTQPTNGQQIVSFAGLAGLATTSTGTIQGVTFSIYNQSTGQWWNGSNYQGASISLPTKLSGANWVPASSIEMPIPCCAQSFQLSASATDTHTNTTTTNINVQVDSVPPAVSFSPLVNGQTVSNLLAIGGSVTDSFTTVASVVFTVWEQDINGGPGRWWNGTNFQLSPANLPAIIAGSDWMPSPGFAPPSLNSGQTYQITVSATDALSNSASTTITVTDAMTTLAWDPGQTPAGTVLLPNPNTNGGNYWFHIIPQSPVVGVWRTALNVLAGAAGVYMSQGSPPRTYSYSFGSANSGSNGFVLDASQYQAGQDWYILVNATTNAQWNVVTGDIYVYNLGSLAADGSSGTNAAIGAEGMIFYETTIPSTVLAWQLWINGAPNTMFVKKSAAPDRVSYDLTQSGQMLIVPPYLAGMTFNGTYFIGVSGTPGTNIYLDSRQQPVTALPFNSLTNVIVTATNFPYVTYEVQVPVQQIAWQLNLMPTSGNPAIAVRNGLVPNEFRNDAFSEVPQGVGASVSLVPPPPGSGAGTPGLSDGTWYVTIYSTAPYTCGFANANPVITPESYVFQVTNDAPNRAGWRYYTLTNIDQQLGSLGWALSLANQVPGTEIAIRRNAVPGQWNYRNSDDYYPSSSLGYVDLSSIYGLLQQPGHQADIWYIGVYTPNQALGSFVLSGNLLTGQPMPLDGAGSSVSVANQPPGQWGFFQIIVPSDTNLLGWDVRLIDVTNGNPQLTICRDTLPTSQGSGWYFPLGSTSWPSSQELGGNLDWTGCGVIPMVVVGMGNPLQAGTYYIAVNDPNNTSSYTLQSRGIGLANYSIPVEDLPITGSATNLALPVGQADYYRIVVPSNTPDWKMRLSTTAGDVLLKVQENYLPASDNLSWYANYGWVYGADMGQLMMKPGDEQWALLPPNGGTTVTAGTYYAVVVSQGQNLTNGGCGYGNAGGGWGPGGSSYTLSSWIEPATVLPNTLSYGNDLLCTNAQAGGETKFYQFTVPAGIASIEVSLQNVVGNPWMTLNYGTNLVAPYYGGFDGYGNYGGTNSQWYSGNLITVANPQGGVYSLSVYGSTGNSGSFPDASYVIQVHAAPPPLIAFDGGTMAITDQAPGQWGFFQIIVPSDTNLLGWDVRLIDVTNGNPQLTICRDTLPTSQGSGWYFPLGSTSWPSSQELGGNLDWTGCGVIPMVVVGMGNPLQAGTYYIAVNDPNNTSSYTLQSRGIGLANYSIPVEDLPITGSATNLALPVGQADYYRIVVPSNTPDWKMRLSTTAGDVLLKVQENYLPASDNLSWYANYGWVYGADMGQLMMKPGDEQWALLPPNGGTTVTAGTYYAVVVSQGQNLTNGGCGYGNAGGGWGPGGSSYTLSSWIEPATVLPNTLSYGNDLLCTNAQAGGETKFYQFTVPAGIASIEVSLQNVVGNPWMTLNYGTNLVAPYYGFDGYGNYGGTNSQWYSGNLITVANPQGGVYSLSVYGSTGNSGTFPDASYVLRVKAPVVPQLSFSPELDTRSLTNVVPGTLADTEHAYYQVIVPAWVAGAPVLGWQLELATLAGSPSVRVRQNLLPDNTCDTTAFASPDAVIVPPFLVPGTWYVDVVGSGSTTYTLTSRVITTNTLTHPVWIMPSVGETNTAPGLALPFIGDSGVDTNGDPLPGDQGIDLARGSYDYYAVMVPTNNAAVLRTELQAISGNPNLYIRVGNAPTVNHFAGGSCDWWDGQLIDRQLTSGTTEYGNWVPLKGRYQSQLTPGLWVLAVQAAGNANARYRLQVSCGNSITNGVVQDMALVGGSFTNQNLDGGNWRYYRVQIPDPAPANWVVNFTRTLGGAIMFVRDSSPPGDGNTTSPLNYANPNYNPGQASTDLQTWNSDDKNEGPYPRFDTPGTFNLTTPPLRPGYVYYLGFWSPVDTTFSLNSETNGGSIQITNSLAFLGGSIATNIPGHGTLQYRMNVPPNATRIEFNASNSTDLVFSLEQGTIALAGGPAHWTSYIGNYIPNGGQANASFDQLLNTGNNWPWLPGYSYYLTVTNTSSTPESFGIFLLLPSDLAPVSVSAPNSIISTRAYPSIQMTWIVTNQGLVTASGNWYDTVWFSTNGVLDGNSIDIGNFWLYSQSVPPGGSYSQTNNVTLPMNWSGNYTLFVQVDAGNYLYEANLSDKVSAGVSGTFALTPPDLMPIGVIAPATVTATQSAPAIQVAWTATNQGIGAATGGWYDRVWFSTDGVLDANSTDIGDFYFSQTVPAGGGYSQTNTVTLPISLGGTYTYTLFVQVDIFNYVYESNKANNISAPVPGALILDLPPQIVTQPVSQFMAPGGTAAFSVAANGTPPLNYQWQLNNANLRAATNTTLVLNNVQPTNTGAYVVVITNAFGAVTSSVASLLVEGAGSNCVSAPAGLIGWWTGEGNADDAVGTNNGTLVGGTTFANGEVGQAFSFDGANQYVAIETAESLTGAFTVEFWFNPMNLNGALGLMGSRSPQDGSFDLQLSANQIHGDIGNGSSWLTTSANANYSFTVGNWYHFALVATPTNYAIYLDGVVAGSGSYGYGIPLLFDPNHQLDIGYIGGYGLFMNGLMDEVSIYDRALSFDEIAANYLAGSYGKCEDVPPTILSQSQSQAVVAGSDAVFNVNAVGQQPLSYQWRKNGMALTNSASVTGSTNASLVVSNVTPSAAGSYSVVVSNAFGSITSTGAVLAVSLLQNGDFASGNMNGWVQSGNTGGTSVSTSPAYAYSGNYGLSAGPSGSLGFLSQTISTVPGQSYLLSFWLDSPGGTPNEFQVSWNGNPVFDQTNVPALGWTNMQFTLLATETNTDLEFGFRNDPYYFGLDDISVTVISTPSPRLANAGFSLNGGFQLTVSGQIGQAYTLQTSTNLRSWTSLLIFTCTNSPVSIVDPTAKNFSHRFYRLVQGTFVAPIMLGFGSAKALTTNGLYLMLQGTIGPNYVIQASTDLVHWQPITNFVSTNSPTYFTDLEATNYSRRFYRVAAP